MFKNKFSKLSTYFLVSERGRMIETSFLIFIETQTSFRLTEINIKQIIAGRLQVVCCDVCVPR